MDENVVTSPEPALAASGDAGVAGRDVVPQDTTQPTTKTPEQWQQEINELRSIKDKEVAEARREAQRLQREYQQSQRQSQVQAQITNRAQQYYQAYLKQGVDPAQAQHAALYYAREDFAQVEQHQSLAEKAQKYDQLTQQQAHVRALTELRDEVLDATGLTKEELAEATKGLQSSDPKFVSQVWKQANAFARTKSTPTQAQSNRQLINGMPLPGAGTTVGGLTYTGKRPPGMSRSEWRKQLIEVKRQLDGS